MSGRRTTPLIRAVRLKRSEAVRFLLDAGANPDLTTNYSRTLMSYAVKNNDIEVVQLLLGSGAFPLQKDSDIETGLSLSLLRTAALNGHIGVAELLLQHIGIESKVTAEANERDELLDIAAMCGSTTIVQQILDTGSYGDARPWGSRTFVSGKSRSPLASAAEKGQLDVAALLLDNGADPWPDTSHLDKKPLITAAKGDHIEVVKLLMARRVNLNTSCEYMHTPLAVGVLE